MWQNFREHYPNPYQTIGFAQFDDQSQLYLISEPPRYVRLEDITDLFEGFDYSVEVKTWQIGYDGWVKDVLISVHYTPPVYKLLFVRQLNELLFANSYKLMCKELPVVQPRRTFIKGNMLDYRISAMELNQWFIEDNMRLAEIENPGNQFPFNELFSRPRPGVYVNADNTLVAWCIPRNSAMGFSRDDIGKFTIESDLIFGAISNGQTLIIIGRGRQCSYAELSPLRIETIEMLAATQDERFSQSLNITELITGKTETGADWCPAYLSDDLENDEFGHILTLTDIFLKDWICKGSLDYPEYHYPKPNYYPFKDGLDKINVRYNWNTDDYIYSTYIGGNQFITLRNTACLNVSLFDNSELKEKGFPSEINQRANDYFAEIQNADIARAVQYTALYKIFRANNVRYPNYSTQYTKDKSSLLLKDTREILTKLRNLSDSEIAEISYRIASDYYDQYLYQNLLLEKEKKQEEWTKDLDAAARAAAQRRGIGYEEYVQSAQYKTKLAENQNRFEAQMQNWLTQSREITISQKAEETSNQIAALNNKLIGINSSDFEKLCSYVSYPNGYTSTDYARIRNISGEITKLYWPIWIYAGYFGISMEKVKNDYVKSLADDNGKWMKTPKIVVIDNKVGRVQIAEGKYITPQGAVVGGHTLSRPVETKSADFSKKPRAVNDVVTTRINRLRTTPDEYNYARMITNTSTGVTHRLPYGKDHHDNLAESAIAHYSAYDENISLPLPQQNTEETRNQNNTIIARYIEHYDDILKPTLYLGNTDDGDNANILNVAKGVGPMDNINPASPAKKNDSEQAGKNNNVNDMQSPERSPVEPFKWTQIEYNGKSAVNIHKGNVVDNAVFYSSMANAEKNKNRDLSKYYAEQAFVEGGSIKGGDMNHPFFERLESQLKGKLPIEMRVSELEKSFSKKGKSARRVLKSVGNLSNATLARMERFESRSNQFLNETYALKKMIETNQEDAKNNEKYTEAIMALEEKSNRMELQARDIQRQAIEDINNCASCSSAEKEKEIRSMSIF